jgi:hypothetical protein
MSTAQKPLVFMSYTQFDDEFEGGVLSRLPNELSRTLKFLGGKDIIIFGEAEDIAPGQQVRQRITQSLNESMIFVPIITPTFFNDTRCREDLLLFINRERNLGRDDLILPVYYQRFPAFDIAKQQYTIDAFQTEKDPLITNMAQRMPIEWQNLRRKEFSDPEVRIALETLAKRIIQVLEEIQKAMRERERQEAILAQRQYAQKRKSRIRRSGPSPKMISLKSLVSSRLFTRQGFFGALGLAGAFVLLFFFFTFFHLPQAENQGEVPRQEDSTDSPSATNSRPYQDGLQNSNITSTTSPEQAVQEYFQLINEQKYEQAFEIGLTSNYQANGPHESLERYITFWEYYDYVNVMTGVVSSDGTRGRMIHENLSTVVARVEFIESGEITSTEVFLFTLKREGAESSWLIDGVNLLEAW